MTHRRVLLCLLFTSCLLTVHGDSSAEWLRTRDDLNGDYQLIDTFAADPARCLFAGISVAHAVQLDEAEHLCRLFVCRGGWHGCRKCRNANNFSLPLVWVRRLGDRPSCWRTFQHRVDGSVDFNQSWSQYVSGFGQGENANHWIGLETLHQMTKDAALPVRWEFSDWNGTLNWMENEFFQVGDSVTKYTVSVGPQLMDRSTVQQCSVTSPSNMNGQKFSTHDQDNDKISGSNCINSYGTGGWWTQSCFCMNPNGVYVSPPGALYLTSHAMGISLKNDAMIYPWDHRYSLKTFECLLMVDAA